MQDGWLWALERNMRDEERREPSTANQVALYHARRPCPRCVRGVLRHAGRAPPGPNLAPRGGRL